MPAVSYNGEIVEQRGPQKTYKFHTGHINYKDDSNVLRKIDWTLEPVIGGWTFTKHSFHPFLPSFADGVAQFRDKFEGKDQTVTYKALAAHVAGAPASDPNNPRFGASGVKYDNAFGVGKDLWYYFTRSRMVKTVSMENPNLATEDAVFEWEVTLPKNPQGQVEMKDLRDAAINADLDIDLRAKGAVHVGESIGTYLRAVEAWDSAGTNLPVQASIIHRDGKLILRKVVPLASLKQAIGTLYTDTDTSYYAGAGDGSTDNNKFVSDGWAAVHDATASTGVQETTSFVTVGIYRDASNLYLRRVFFPIDTSGITDTDTINAAVFFVKVGIKAGSIVPNYGIVQTTQASTSGLVVEDYDQCGAVTNPTEGATRISFTDEAWNSWTLNATGRGWIDKTGFTKLGLRVDYDMDNTGDPGANNHRYQYEVQMSEGILDAYLTVTTTAGVALLQIERHFPRGDGRGIMRP